METTKQTLIELFAKIKMQNPNSNLDFDAYLESLLETIPQGITLKDIQFSYIDQICCWTFYIQAKSPNIIDHWLYDDSNEVHITKVYRNLYQASIFAY